MATGHVLARSTCLPVDVVEALWGLVDVGLAEYETSIVDMFCHGYQLRSHQLVGSASSKSPISQRRHNVGPHDSQLDLPFDLETIDSVYHPPTQNLPYYHLSRVPSSSAE